MQEERDNADQLQKGVELISVATYFHSPSPFTFFFYQNEGAMSVKKSHSKGMCCLT